MEIVVQPHAKIFTHGVAGRPNGFLVPIFNMHDAVLRPEQFPHQVYLTVIAPRQIKGPHLHLKRWGLFTCIKWNARVIVRGAEGYREFLTGEDHDFLTIQVPAGLPTALQNLGDIDAYVEQLRLAQPGQQLDALLRVGVRHPQPVSDLKRVNGEPTPIVELVDALARWATPIVTADVDAADDVNRSGKVAGSSP